MYLHTGMRVKIKDDRKNFSSNAGKVKKITQILPDFQGMRSFELDFNGGIWSIADFEYCVDYPDSEME